MPLNTIAIIGASVRAAAMSAVRAGLSPVAADLFADEDLRAICPGNPISPYPTGLADWLDNTPADAWIYTGALENYPALVDAAGRRKQLFGNTGSVLRRIRSPFLVQRALSDQGFSFPRTLNDSLGIPKDGTWLAKSFRGSSGSGVEEYRENRTGESRVGPDHSIDRKRTARAATGNDAADGNEATAGSEEEKRFYQKRIDGSSGSAVFVAHCGGADLLGITRQLVGTAWTHSKRFQYAGSVGPWQIGRSAAQQIRSIGKTLADQFDLIGLFGVDFIYDGDAVWTVEVNPRYTSSVEIVERTAKLHALAFHAEACAGRRPDFAATLPQGCHGKAILFARRDLVIPPAFTAWAIAKGGNLSLPAIADIPSAGTPIRRGQPITTAFASDQTENDVLKQLEARLSRIEAICQ